MMTEAMGMLKVLCARSMTSAVKALAADFTRETGNDVDLGFGTCEIVGRGHRVPLSSWS